MFHHLFTALAVMAIVLVGTAEAHELPDVYPGKYIFPASGQTCQKPILTVSKTGFEFEKHTCQLINITKDVDGTYYHFRCAMTIDAKPLDPALEVGIWSLSGKTLTIERGGDSLLFRRCN